MPGTKTTKAISLYRSDIVNSRISPAHDIYKVKHVLKQKYIKFGYLHINKVETVKERFVKKINRQSSQP